MLWPIKLELYCKKIMIEIKNLIDNIGLWNLFSLLTFIIGTIYSTYTYFKSFYRIVYSEERICNNCKSVKNWQDDNQKFTSRLIFYNNGRKTLTKTELKKIQISSSEISSIKIISDVNNIKSKISDNKKKLYIEFDYLDASRFFVIQLNHNGFINVKGRVAETGSFLHTETKGWLIANFALIFYLFASIFYILFSYSNEKLLMTKMATNMILIMLFYSLFRFIHKLFFIPDNITSKYLGTTDKRNTEFNTKL